MEKLNKEVEDLAQQAAGKKALEQELAQIKKDMDKISQEAEEAKANAARHKKAAEAAAEKVAELEDMVKELEPKAAENEDISKMLAEAQKQLDQAKARVGEAEDQYTEWKNKYNEQLKTHKTLKEKASQLERENKGLKQEQAALEEERNNIHDITNKNKQITKENEKLKGDKKALEKEIKKHTENLEGKEGTVHAWLKYLFLLFLYILGSELCSVIDSNFFKWRRKFFNKNGIVQIINPDGKVTLEGINDAQFKIYLDKQKGIQKVKTILWIGIILGAGFYLVEVMEMSLGNIWIPATIAIVMYGYLRKRYDLL